MPQMGLGGGPLQDYCPLHRDGIQALLDDPWKKATMIVPSRGLAPTISFQDLQSNCPLRIKNEKTLADCRVLPVPGTRSGPVPDFGAQRRNGKKEAPLLVRNQRAMKKPSVPST